MIERRKLTLPPKPTKEQRLACFKGKRNTSGRKKGTPNKLTKTLKEAIILAAEAEGSDGKGKEGLVGYLRSVARDRPAVYAHLLGKLLPLEVQAHLLQLQLQLQGNASTLPVMNGDTPINVNEIRGAPTEQLKQTLTMLRRMMTPTKELQRLDIPREQATNAQVIDHEPTPIEAEPVE